MGYKKFPSKFTLQTQTKCKNTKIQTRLQELCLFRYVFSVISQNIYSTIAFYCQNSDIREVSIDLE